MDDPVGWGAGKGTEPTPESVAFQATLNKMLRGDFVGTGPVELSAEDRQASFAMRHLYLMFRETFTEQQSLQIIAYMIMGRPDGDDQIDPPES